MGGQQHDQFVIKGPANFGASTALELRQFEGFNSSVAQSFVIVDTQGTVSGLLGGFEVGHAAGKFSGHHLYITYQGGDGDDIELYTN